MPQGRLEIHPRRQVVRLRQRGHIRVDTYRQREITLEAKLRVTDEHGVQGRLSPDHLESVPGEDVTEGVQAGERRVAKRAGDPVFACERRDGIGLAGAIIAMVRVKRAVRRSIPLGKRMVRLQFLDRLPEVDALRAPQNLSCPDGRSQSVGACPQAARGIPLPVCDLSQVENPPMADPRLTAQNVRSGDASPPR